MPRAVLVDNTDNRIHYSSGWNVEDGSKWASQGNFGAPFMNSLQSTNAASASFSFDFDGSDVTVWMTSNVLISEGSQDPIWGCIIDGKDIPVNGPFQYTENNWKLCESSANQVSPGKHMLTVTSKSSGRALLFDYITYTPSPSLSISNAFIQMMDNDPAIQYGSGWQSIDGIGRVAGNGGSTTVLSFYGTGLIWIANQPKEFPQEDSAAEYSVDDGSPTSFIIQKPGDTQFFRQYFQVTGLPLGSHKLTVTSKGKTSQTPLVLTSVILQNSSTNPPSSSNGPIDTGNTIGSGNNNDSGGNSASSNSSSNTIVQHVTTITTMNTINGSKTVVITNPASTTVALAGGNSNVDNSGNIIGGPSNGNHVDDTSSSNSGQTNKSNSTPTTQQKNGAPIGGIIGGIIGAFVVIGLIVALLFFRYRRLRRRKKEQLRQEMQQAFSENVQPFYRNTIAPQATHSTSGSTQPSSYAVHQYTNHYVGHGRGILPPSKNSNRSYSTSTPSKVSSSGLSESGRAKYQEAFVTETEIGPAHPNIVAVTLEDSGIRLLQPATIDVVELPPLYSHS